MSDAVAIAGAIAANSISAVVAGCAGLHVSAPRLATHVAKPVEVQAVKGSEIIARNMATWPSWISDLYRRQRINTYAKCVSFRTESGVSTIGAEGWAVRYPDGRLDFLTAEEFAVRFRPLYGEVSA